MRSKYILILIIFASFFFINQKSSKDEISKRKGELEKLRKQIKEYEGKLDAAEKKEKSTIDVIDRYDKKGILLNQLINKISDEVTYQEDEAQKIENELKLAELKLDYLRNDYAKYVISMYKRGKTRDLELVFSSNSLNQMYIRLEYLKRFTESRINELRKIEAQKDTIDLKALALKERIDEKKYLLEDKKSEETNLQKLIVKKKTALADIKKDQQVFKKEIDRKNRAAKDVERMISKLIDEEIKRRESAASKKDKHEISKEKHPKTGFFARKGNLMWPVQNGKVVNHFGNQVHPTLKTVTLNYGIDISVPEGSNVRSVADGEVSVVYFVAGYGNVVIISHYDGFRTVYAHLSQIMVKEGTMVREGQVIAKSGESISGEILHFQIWKNRDQQNPESWLTSR
jgi:murein hydrolase activator